MTSVKRQSKMPLSSLLSNKWTKHQLDNLQSIVLSIRPNSISGWRKVCLKMHEIGSRKTYMQYKVPGDALLAKKQRIQIKLSRDQIRNIFQRFGQGCSLHELTQKYGAFITNKTRVRQMIAKKLKLITMVMRQTIGRRNIRNLGTGDHRFFKFIRERELLFVSMNQVADHCERYRLIQKSKDEEHLKERQSIRLYLNRFNGFIKAYWKKYQEAEKPIPHRGQYQPHPRVIDIPSIPSLHLAKVLQQNLQMQQQQQQQASFSLNGIDFDDKENILRKRRTRIDLCFQMQSQDDSSLISREKFIQCFGQV